MRLVDSRPNPAVPSHGACRGRGRGTAHRISIGGFHRCNSPSGEPVVGDRSQCQSRAIPSSRRTMIGRDEGSRSSQISSGALEKTRSSFAGRMVQLPRAISASSWPGVQPA